MEHLNIERQTNGFKVSVEGMPHQMIVMLGVLCADICERLKIPPEVLAASIPLAVEDAVRHVHRKESGT